MSKRKGNAAKRADHHPHFAGVRHAGHDVAAAHHANTSPRPGKTEFSAQEEQAMRDAAAGASPMGGAPMPSDNDADDAPGAAPSANDLDADDGELD